MKCLPWDGPQGRKGTLMDWGANKYTNFVVGLGYRILEPIGMHSDARDKARKSAHCGPKDKVRWPWCIIHRARALSTDNVLAPSSIPPSSLSFIHGYLFSTTETHPCGSSIPLSYRLGTQNTGTLIPCNKPGDFILAHFTICVGQGMLGPQMKRSLAHKRFFIHPSFQFTNLTPRGLCWFTSHNFD